MILNEADSFHTSFNENLCMCIVLQ